MAEPRETGGGNWFNRAMMLLIAAMSLVFGAPLVFYGIVAIVAAVDTGQTPAFGIFLTGGMGLALLAFGIAAGWAALLPKRRTP